MVHSKDINPSEGEDVDTVAAEATRLVDDGRWRVCNEGKGLEREFRFKTFKATWDFMNTVAAECKKQRHHPEWTNVYNRTHIRWTTHSPAGLSTKDTTMAKFCDGAAAEAGELPVEPAEGKSKGVVGSEKEGLAGDCCVGKTKV